MEKLKILCLSLLILSAACNNQNTDSQEGTPCEIAEKLYNTKGNQGSYRSQTFLDSAIHLCPEFSKAWREIGVPYLKRGDYASWLEYLDKAIDQAPEDYLDIRAWCKVKFIHDYSGALRDFQRLDSLYQGAKFVGDNNIYSCMAICEFGLGNIQSALHYINKSIDIATAQHGEKWVGLYDFLYRGNIKLSLHDMDGALDDFEKQITNTNESADSHYYKGITLLKLGHKKEGKESLVLAKSLLQGAGYGMHDPYVELPWQVYIEDIENELSNLD